MNNIIFDFTAIKINCRLQFSFHPHEFDILMPILKATITV